MGRPRAKSGGGAEHLAVLPLHERAELVCDLLDAGVDQEEVIRGLEQLDPAEANVSVPTRSLKRDEGAGRISRRASAGRNLGGIVGRRRPVEQPQPERGWEREFTRLRRTLRAHEPGTPAEAVSRKIMAEANAIEARQPDRALACTELTDLLAALGLTPPPRTPDDATGAPTLGP